MSWKRIIYLLLVMVIAGVSALTGAVAGGAVVYTTVSKKQAANPSILISASNPNNNTPAQTLVLNSTDAKTSVTQAVQKVGPAVVKIVGTILRADRRSDRQRQRVLHLGQWLYPDE